MTPKEECGDGQQIPQRYTTLAGEGGGCRDRAESEGMWSWTHVLIGSGGCSVESGRKVSHVFLLRMHCLPR